MNVLTNIRSRQRQREQEVINGVPESASYHSEFKKSAYIYVGQLSFNLTEGDILAIFSEYGEIVDVNLVREKKTGKSRGFAFLAYEDQKSTDIAVDNLNGFKIDGRIISVDHVADYKRLIENPDYKDQAPQVDAPSSTGQGRNEAPRPRDANESVMGAQAKPSATMPDRGGPTSIAAMLREVEGEWKDWRKLSHSIRPVRHSESPTKLQNPSQKSSRHEKKEKKRHHAKETKRHDKDIKKHRTSKITGT